MLKYFALPEIWNSRWTARSVALELFTFITAPMAIGCTIITAIFIRIGKWPIMPGALIEFLCLIYAFCALGFPILPRNQKNGWKEAITRSIWIVIPGLASVLVWVISGIKNPDLFVHLVLIIVSVSIALGIQQKLFLISPSVLPPLWIRRIDGFRLGLLVFIIGGAAMFYILLTNFAFV